MTQRHSAFWVGEVSPLLPLITGDGSHKFAVAGAIRQQIGGYHAGHGTKTEPFLSLMSLTNSLPLSPSPSESLFQLSSSLPSTPLCGPCGL